MRVMKEANSWSLSSKWCARAAVRRSSREGRLTGICQPLLKCAGVLEPPNIQHKGERLEDLRPEGQGVSPRPLANRRSLSVVCKPGLCYPRDVNVGELLQETGLEQVLVAGHEGRKTDGLVVGVVI